MSETPAVADRTTELVTALTGLRQALAAVQLPLDVPDAETHRGTRSELVNQLEDYVLPRLLQIEAPLLTGPLPTAVAPWGRRAASAAGTPRTDAAP